MNKISLTIIILFISLTCWKNGYSQEKKDFESFKKNASISLGEYYKTYHSRKPSSSIDTILPENILKEDTTSISIQKTRKTLEMPEKFWFPGEFEEVQAILITWSYAHIDKAMQNYVTPVDENLAFRYSNGQYIITEYTSFIDTSSDTRMPIIFAQLADAIQKGGAQVWINICNAQDSSIVKKYMENHGMPLSNYRFFVYPGNSFWYRDCGPVAFYSGTNDDVAFLDFEYYGGRPADDKIPIRVGNEINVPVYTTTFEFEGGNILLDGAGTLFTSDQIYDANEDNYGLFRIINGVGGYTRKTPLTENQIHDTLNHLLGLSRLEILPMLQNDGGTGHIDLYATMWDENNFVFTKYPDEMSRQTDYRISSENVNTILSLPSYHGKLYQGENIPLPKKDDGSWYTNANDFEKYTRTYSNSTFVNNVIIQPIFSNDSWGAREWDLQSIEIMKEKFPGYEIIPIDIRGYQNDQEGYTGFDGTGGAIHCITKQIPAENPIRILHAPIQGTIAGHNGLFPVDARITNKSGIKSATCYWRIKGSEKWNSMVMNSKSDNIFSSETRSLYSADLHREKSSGSDTIEYYISATSNNGKTITKPFTAPKGFYTFSYEYKSERVSEDPIFISNFFPNPAEEFSRTRIQNAHDKELTVQVSNIFGQIVFTGSFTSNGNDVLFELNTFSLSNGVYFISFIDEQKNITTRKLIVQY